ncbi:unnamed protein product [Linum trigynum]|uniref:Uncharacterized protein n=1 Tax=Linum trigynum TaxID=586398 RepID=A0AAV2D7Q5_9ROSI
MLHDDKNHGHWSLISAVISIWSVQFTTPGHHHRLGFHLAASSCFWLDSTSLIMEADAVELDLWKPTPWSLIYHHQWQNPCHSIQL